MTYSIADEIKRISDEFLEEIISIRRHIHKYPELSFHEYKTSAYIKNLLEEKGIVCQIIGDTGVLASIKGTQGNSSSVVALRSDIDALPIKEQNEIPFKSINEGVMHACGHDIHAASLIATAFILNKLRDRFSGTVRFIFQPAEEIAPGGALKMIQGGVLKDPKPVCIFGQHSMPELAAGKIGIRSGNYMAAKDEIYLTIVGKGGHAAMPHLLIDPIAIGCELISTLQQVISRRSNPLIPAVLSFGRFIGDGSNNVIPNEVSIEGSLRSLDEREREKAVSMIRGVIGSVVKSMGGTFELEIRRGYPVLKNDESVTNWVKEKAIDILGEENVVDLDLWTASEDFAYYLQDVPGAYYRLGVGNKGPGLDSGLHTPTFLANEAALLTGPVLMSYLALEKLRIKE